MDLCAEAAIVGGGVSGFAVALEAKKQDLSFGQIDRGTGKTLRTDPAWLAASPVQMAERMVGEAQHRVIPNAAPVEKDD